MSKKKLLEKKKQRREEVAKSRIQRRRVLKAKTDKMQKEERAKALANDPKIEPFMRKETKERRVQEQLEHNMQILKSLEEEYDKEMAGRKDVDKELTEQGFVTLEDRIKEIQRRINDDANQMNILQGEGQGHFGYKVKGGIGGVQ